MNGADDLRRQLAEVSAQIEAVLREISLFRRLRFSSERLKIDLRRLEKRRLELDRALQVFEPSPERSSARLPDTGLPRRS